MRPAGFLLHSRCAAALQAVPGCVLVCAAWFCSALALPGCVHQPLPHAAAGAQQAGRHMSVVSSCSGRALARSRPTPSLPHAPRAPRLVSSTLLDAMSPCTCAAASVQPLALCQMTSSPLGCAPAPPPPFRRSRIRHLARAHNCAQDRCNLCSSSDKCVCQTCASGNLPVSGNRPAKTLCTRHEQHSRAAGSAGPAGPPCTRLESARAQEQVKQASSACCTEAGSHHADAGLVQERERLRHVPRNRQERLQAWPARAGRVQQPAPQRLLQAACSAAAGTPLPSGAEAGVNIA
jgi:hypothetical protein